jgi:CheY-like chemotaxis protein
MSATPPPVILFVEDEALLRLVIADELREAGFEVIEAADGGSALDALKDGARIDLLFTDIRMPGRLNGWDVAEQARSLKPDIPVIYATGFSDDGVRLVPNGRFFKKPYRASAIVDAARELGVAPTC